MNQISYNKVCEIEDFSDNELVNIIRDVFKHEIMQFPPEYPNGVADSKQWEIAMTIRALKNFNILQRNSVVLGVGVGTEVTNFYLTKHVQQVFATDLYFNAGVWSDVAPFLMLVEPEGFAPYDYENNRLVVQHMDGRYLQYPDNTFDGIFSSGSIEHFGSLNSIANASFEMGRVLKPGGILTLSTEYKVSGPPDGDGWDTSTFILSRNKIMKYIVEASGLELVDDFDTKISKNTMLIQRNLATFLENTKGEINWEQKIANYPNLILVHSGYVFCSAHLTLRKSNQYPLSDNSLASPSEITKQEIIKMRDHGVSEHVKKIFQISDTKSNQNNNCVPQIESTTGLSSINITPVINAFDEWQILRLSPDTLADQHKHIRKNKILTFLYRTFYRIRKLGKVWEAQRFLYENYNGILQNIIWQIEENKTLIKDQSYNNSNLESLLASQKNILANQNSQIVHLKDEINNSKISIDKFNEELSNQNSQIVHLKDEINNSKISIDKFSEELSNQKTVPLETITLQQDQIQKNINDIYFQTHMISSHLRYIEYNIGLSEKSLITQEIPPINGLQLVDFIHTVENRFPELASKSPVEIFISPISLEEPLFAIVEYLNKRIDPFQIPSIIYYFNFSSQHDDVLQKTSIRQLNLNGYFIQITSGEIQEIEGTELIYSKEIYFGENKYNNSIFRK